MAKEKEVVREKGLEPLPRKPGLGPQPSASANSATRAQWVRREYRIAPHPCQGVRLHPCMTPTPGPISSRSRLSSLPPWPKSRLLPSLPSLSK